MFQGISPVINPGILAILHNMGHGDELAIILKKGAALS